MSKERAFFQSLLRRHLSMYNWIVIGALLVAALVPLVVNDQYLLHTGIFIVLMAYLATSWGLVGQSGQLSFGHVAFLGISAYTSTILYNQFGVTPWIGGFAGAGLATVAGAVIGYPTLRLRGVYFALATLAFAYILQIFVQSTTYIGPILLGGAPGLHIALVNNGDAPGLFQFGSKLPYYYIVLGMLAGSVALSYWFNRTRTGYYWAAIRDDPDAAESLGINVAKYRIRAFLVSCFLTGLGGTFYAQYFQTVDPRRILGLDFSIQISLVGIVGGWQSVFGPMIGALVLTPIGQVIRNQLSGSLSGLDLLVYGIVLMVFIRFLPKGLNEPVMKGLRLLEAKIRKLRSVTGLAG